VSRHNSFDDIEALIEQLAQVNAEVAEPGRIFEASAEPAQLLG
jgi:hypothetical protein